MYTIGEAVGDADSIQKGVHAKTDQETAMLAFQARVQKARKSKTTPVNSPKGDYHANGRAKHGVQAFQQMARRMRLAMSGHIGVRMSGHAVLMWLV